MTKRIALCFASLLALLSAQAGVPVGYYASIDGTKSTSLKAALTDIISQHSVFDYADLWEYYPSCYYAPSNHRQVLDMYSNEVRYFSSSTPVPNMNKEHTVPKSWWAVDSKESSYRTCNGYSDLFNVIPSDASANGKKSDHPVGIVTASKPALDNGISKIGKGSVAGHEGTFFEPADKYKGDFARIYFYMATCYPSATWENSTESAMSSTSPLTIQSWLYPLLVEWSKADPVDADEIQRCEDVFQLQGNRNPFVDYPELADYIWGADSTHAFNLTEHTANQGTPVALRACEPIFALKGGTNLADAFETLSGTQLTINGGNKLGILFTRINGGEWNETKFSTGTSSGGNTYNNAPQKVITLSSESLVEAYCTYPERSNSDTLHQYFTMTDETPYLLIDDFNSIASGNNTSTSGSTTKWNGDERFPIVNGSVYCAGAALRLGTTKLTGSITSRALTFSGGTLEVTVDGKGWDKDAMFEIAVYSVGNDTLRDTITIAADMNVAFKSATATISGCPANAKVRVSTTAGALRAFIDKIAIKGTSSNSLSTAVMDERKTTFYTLDGHRVAKPHSGRIYLSKGKKAIIP